MRERTTYKISWRRVQDGGAREFMWSDDSAPDLNMITDISDHIQEMMAQGHVAQLEYKSNGNPKTFLLNTRMIEEAHVEVLDHVFERDEVTLEEWQEDAIDKIYDENGYRFHSKLSGRWIGSHVYEDGRIKRRFRFDLDSRKVYF